MSQLTPAELKTHLRLATDFNGDDARLQGLIDAAETRICGYLRRDLDTDYPDGWPQDIRQSVLVYAAFLDEHYAPGEEPDMKQGLPMIVADLLANYRDFSL